MSGSPSTDRAREGLSAPPVRWRILRDPPAPAAWNMAVDEALARTLAPDEGVLRIYRWARPTLSFGRNQPARGRYDPATGPAFGAEFVRRPTGGREVLHDRELTYAVVLPAHSLGGPRRAYGVLNRGLVAALRSLGVAAGQTGAGAPALRPDAGACFRAPAAGEVEVGGRKIVGSAQVRIGGVVLQHGSLLLRPPTLALAALRAPGPAGGGGARGGSPDASGEEETSITLEGALTESVGFPRIAAAVEAAMAAELGGSWARGELREDEREVADGLLHHYQSSTWTWRR